MNISVSIFFLMSALASAHSHPSIRGLVASSSSTPPAVTSSSTPDEDVNVATPPNMFGMGPGPGPHSNFHSGDEEPPFGFQDLDTMCSTFDCSMIDNSTLDNCPFHNSTGRTWDKEDGFFGSRFNLTEDDHLTCACCGSGGFHVHLDDICSTFDCSSVDNSTISNCPYHSFKDGEGFFEHGHENPINERLADEDFLTCACCAVHSGDFSMHGPGPNAPGGSGKHIHDRPHDFQARVNGMCSTYQCPALDDSTSSDCPLRNSTRFERNEWGDRGQMGKSSVMAGRENNQRSGNDNQKFDGEKPDGESLLACVCCDGITVDELDDTGVDTSGLSLLVSSDPNSITVDANGCLLNSFVFGSAVAYVATVVSMFI